MSVPYRSTPAILMELGRLIATYMSRKVMAGLSAGMRAAKTGTVEVNPADEIACARLEAAIDALCWVLGAEKAPSGTQEGITLDFEVLAGMATETSLSRYRRQSPAANPDYAELAKEALRVAGTARASQRVRNDVDA